MSEAQVEFTPLNIRAFFSNELGACGCSDMSSMIAEIRRLLEWHEQETGARVSFSELYSSEGLFYLMAGLLDDCGLSEHGTAIRHPWLTDRGRELLSALRACTPREIEEASGEAYDGCWYE